MSRSKDYWLQKTGGFRLGESKDQFEARLKEIEQIEKRLKAKPTMKDVNRLRFLKGTTNEHGEFVDESYGL